jgi:prepilin-type N-terminal cleavage/methylation domain-containing protein
MHRQQGFSLLELTIATAILSLACALVASALVLSQDEARTYLGEMGRPSEALALALLRHDVRSARAVSLQPGWSTSPLRLELDDAVVTYRTDGGVLRRAVSSRGAAETATTPLPALEQWQWRTPTAGVVEVAWTQTRSGAVRRGRPARDRHEVSTLRLALRNGPRSRW